jgi:hypothetical protein
MCAGIARIDLNGLTKFRDGAIVIAILFQSET